MTATNHALTGAAVATVIAHPLLAIPLAFASHFVCDALPHFDSGLEFGKKSMYVYLGGELLAMVVLFTYLVFVAGVTNVFYLSLASIVAMSPDLAWLYYGVKNGDPREHNKQDIVSRFHSKIQWSATKWGIVPELFWAGLMISVILK